MTSKEYLQQYYNCTQLILQTTNEIEALSNERDAIQVAIDGMPHGTQRSDKTGSLATKIADMVLELMELRNKSIDKRKKVWQAISAVQDPILRTLLYKRYVECEKFEKIALDMGYSYSRTIHLHGEALKKVVVPDDVSTQ